VIIALLFGIAGVCEKKEIRFPLETSAAACCSVLQRVASRCSLLPYAAVYMLLCVAVGCAGKSHILNRV